MTPDRQKEGDKCKALRVKIKKKGKNVGIEEEIRVDIGSVQHKCPESSMTFEGFHITARIGGITMHGIQYSQILHKTQIHT